MTAAEEQKLSSSISERISELHYPRKSDRAGWSSAVHCTVDDEPWPCAHVQAHGRETFVSWEEIDDELLDHAVSRVRRGVNRLTTDEGWLQDLETVINAAYSNRK